MIDTEDKIVYVKISDVYTQPNITIDGNDGPLLDESGEQLFSDMTPYE